MTAPDETDDDATQAGSTREGDVGDVETAGETTAAATAGGNTTVEKPVGGARGFPPGPGRDTFQLRK